MDTRRTIFAQALSQLRATKKLSQQQLAALTGYTRNYIYYLEMGRRGPPSSRFIQTICEKLGLAPAECDALFRAAGYIPPQPAPRDTLLAARALLAPYLRTPIAACAVDRDGAILFANAAFSYIFELDINNLTRTQRNILLLLLDASGLGGRIINWQSIVQTHEALLQSLSEVRGNAVPARTTTPWWKKHPVLGQFSSMRTSGPIVADILLKHSKLDMITLNIAPIYSPQANGLLALTYLPANILAEEFFARLAPAAMGASSA
jgi:transcriptional regulator with XRE-family HTH domain